MLFFFVTKLMKAINKVYIYLEISIYVNKIKRIKRRCLKKRKKKRKYGDTKQQPTRKNPPQKNDFYSKRAKKAKD